MWIDVRQRRPTEEDANTHDHVLWMYADGDSAVLDFDEIDNDIVAWMPIPPYTPLPAIPDGYRLLRPNEYGQKKHPKAMFLEDNEWVRISCFVGSYCRTDTYIVPIEPKYRPFRDAAEFRPYRDRWWRQKLHKADRCCPPGIYGDDGYLGLWTWVGAFEQLEFEDGTPFGVVVTDE